ncbi:ParB/RepB/Spo0J family partition protein [Pseudoroseomonas cervicalis]|uniref:ParB/RepB/Spo0J family partition protein n=1 Tax=Teichococcus cervicalis TaxID=204525 RepID=UPI0022F1CB20|nr:ParB/RepB/Spo0J family partition protein [Pseudoroseomonas cervicalis]WBV45528.1 ParB/RepB/Spo0J family partition protein [Pseudoroseomonas cervicalis]
MARVSGAARKTARAEEAPAKAPRAARAKDAAQHGRLVQLQGQGADGPRFSIELVTPEGATALLARKRPAAGENAAAIHAYAEAMREGRWILNGMPIILSRGGVLLDGVQRLRACIKAGLPFLTVMAQNIPDDVLHTIDQQRRRSFAGVLEARGIPHAHALQSALVKLIRYEDGKMLRGAGTASWSRMDRVLRANPDLEQAVKMSLESEATALSEAVRTPLLFMGFRVDKAATRRFLDAVAWPEKYAPLEPGARIRDLIELTRGDPATRLKPVTLFALCIKALNATLAGETPRSFAWIDRSANPTKGEEFPRLEGYAGLDDPGLPGETEETAQQLRAAVERLTQEENVFPLSIETITPEMAEAYLGHNTRNRKIVAAHVDAIARDIRAGNWMMNAQPICFSRSGRLLNGQHRLSAVIQAGEPIEVPVMRGLPEEAYATYDIHAKKGPQLGTGFENFGDRPLIAAAAVLLWKRELKPAGTRNAKPTPSEVMRIVEQHPRLLEMRTFGRKMIEFGRGSVLAYAAYCIERDDAELGRVFLERFESGADLPRGHLILELRKRMQILRRERAGQEEQLKELLGAWSRFKEKPDLGRL